jgi:hypothetical protein
VFAHDQHHVARNRQIGEGRTADNGGSGRGWECEAGERNERARPPALAWR